jgi:D-alanine-D-alanine ligase
MEQGVNFEQVSELDVIFPVLHGTFGEDGTMQGLLEMADVAYVGAGVTGSAVAMDKGIFKDVMRAHSIPVLEAVTVLRSELSENIDSLLDKLETIAPYPLFTKPANLGSSVGVTKCQTRSDLYEGLLDAAQYDRRILVERGLNNAREIEVSVLGNDDPISSIAGEIVPGEDFYSYTAKYHDDNSQLLIPAALNETQMAQVRVDAVRAYKAIDCGGMARVDFLMDPETGSLYLNEINTIPGFTSISMYPKLWEATGIPYSKLLDKLVHFALERKRDRDQTTRTFARAG